VLGADDLKMTVGTGSAPHKEVPPSEQIPSRTHLSRIIISHRKQITSEQVGSQQLEKWKSGNRKNIFIQYLGKGRLHIEVSFSRTL